VKDPADESMHDNVEVPEPITVFGALQLSPVEGETLRAKLTAPLNRFNELTEIVEVPA